MLPSIVLLGAAMGRISMATRHELLAALVGRYAAISRGGAEVCTTTPNRPGRPALAAASPSPGPAPGWRPAARSDLRRLPPSNSDSTDRRCPAVPAPSVSHWKPGATPPVSRREEGAPPLGIQVPVVVSGVFRLAALSRAILTGKAISSEPTPITRRSQKAAARPKKPDVVTAPLA